MRSQAQNVCTMIHISCNFPAKYQDVLIRLLISPSSTVSTHISMHITLNAVFLAKINWYFSAQTSLQICNCCSRQNINQIIFVKAKDKLSLPHLDLLLSFKSGEGLRISEYNSLMQRLLLSFVYFHLST